MNKISTAVFPVAGLGTRFLPATKCTPKEMLPVVDKPLIQYAVEEAIEAGCTKLVFITGRNKRGIEDHFDMSYELENELSCKNKNQLLEHIQDILPNNVSCLYIRQAQALGLGHAILKSQPAINDEAFAVILADDLIEAQPGVLSQMIQRYYELGHSIVGVEEVPHNKTSDYGIVQLREHDPEQRITHIVEKPHPSEAPSNLAVVGRYILTPKIYELLATVPRGSGGEIQLTDGLSRLLQYEALSAFHYQGTRFDCGSKLGYLEANLCFGLRHPQIGKQFCDKVLAVADRLKGEV